MHQVLDDLETYQHKRNAKNVLLFPPLPSRLRYLIHRKVEDLPELATFSVGESWCRRVVVCPSELRAESDEDNDVESISCVSEERPGSVAAEPSNIKAKPVTSSQRRATKRPDQPLYVPRAARERLPLQDSQASATNKDCRSSAECSRLSVSGSSDSCSCSTATEQKIYSASSAQEACATDDITEVPESELYLCHQETAKKSLLRQEESEAIVWDQAQLSFAEMNLEDSEREDLSSDQAVDPEDVTEQIKMGLKDMDISVELAHSDYSMYENVFLNADDFSHVLEIYDFPHYFNTDDLLEAFVEYRDGGMKIKWVDHTHALGVFSSEGAALHALSICHPLLRARPLSEGSKKSQAKAVRRAEFIQPVKERPRTDCAVAKRMVTRALGVRGRGKVLRY